MQSGELTTPDGRTRSYLWFVPEVALADSEQSDRVAAVPLVVALHGGGESAARFQAASGLTQLAERHGFALIYPDGIGGGVDGSRRRGWNAGWCCGAARSQGVDDVGFVDQLVEVVSENAAIDPERLFAIGHSNGGMMAFRLALELPGRFAAIGVQSASIAMDRHRPEWPTSLIAVHGGSDRHHPIDGGRGPDSKVETPYGSVREACADFATAANAGEPTTIEFASQVGFAEEVKTTRWPNPGGAEVCLIEVGSGTHSWMGSPRVVVDDAPMVGGAPYAGFDTASTIWEFLSEHRQRGGPAAMGVRPMGAD